MEPLANNTIDFADYYAKKISPYIDEYEEMRIIALANRRHYRIIAACLTAAAALIVYYVHAHTNISEDPKSWINSISLLVVGMAWVFTQHPEKEFKKDIKKGIFPLIFKYINATYKPQRPFFDIEQQYGDSEIIPSHDYSHPEDFVTSEYEGVGIEMCDVVLKKRRHKRTDKIIFKGVFISLEMHKKFLGKTILKKDGGKVGNWFANKLSHLERVKLEDPVFEKQFEVYSNDQVEARFLLTPDMMERIAGISDLYDGAQVQCSFYDSKLLLIVPTRKDMFEPESINVPVTFKDEVITIMSEMTLIHGIIDLLKLKKP